MKKLKKHLMLIWLCTTMFFIPYLLISIVELDFTWILIDLTDKMSRLMIITELLLSLASASIGFVIYKLIIKPEGGPVRSYIKGCINVGGITDQCPECKIGQMIHDDRIILTNPPKYKYTCDKCGYNKTVFIVNKLKE